MASAATDVRGGGTRPGRSTGLLYVPGSKQRLYQTMSGVDLNLAEVQHVFMYNTGEIAQAVIVCI